MLQDIFLPGKAPLFSIFTFRSLQRLWILRICRKSGDRIYRGFAAKIFTLLQKESRPKCPFNQEIGVSHEVIWVAPRLVVEVAFTEWTEEGHLRHPSFKGLRLDKRPDEAVKERKIRLITIVVN